VKIKSTIVVAAAAGSAFAPNAHAQPADASMRAQRMTPAPAWTWTGFYVGAHLGYGWQDTSANGAYIEGANTFPWKHTADSKGFLGGGQIGYNWQAGFVVFGVEADITGVAGITQGATTFIGPATITTAQGVRWFGTVRGRLGVTVAPRTMVYGTGGLAYGKVQNQSTANEDGEQSFAVADQVKTGYAAGGGIEHAILDNVTVRLEGLFVDLGSSPSGVARVGSCNTTCVPVNFTSDNKVTTVRGGINVRF
jgi:outer membrane immunogenic protein